MTKYDPKVVDTQNTDLGQIVGKTIAKAMVEPIAPYYDDIPHLILIFDDGTSVRITATYGMPTGHSIAESPRQIELDFFEPSYLTP